MSRTLALEATKRIGKKVTLAGWVWARRDHGKLVFFDLLDRSGIVQVVSGAAAGELSTFDVVLVEGLVRERTPKTINPKIPTGKVEVKAEKFKVISKAEELPFEMSVDELNISLPTLLDYRALTLRHPKIKEIFKVQETVIDAFRNTLRELGFTEFQAPAIVPVATEGGSALFPVGYYDHKAYLGQSPQLYKQIMVGVFELVFTVTKAFRAEPSTTTRHLSEYVSLDAEMGFIESWEEIMDTAEAVMRGIFAAVKKNHGIETPKLGEKIPRIRLSEVTKEPDLSPDDERKVGEWAVKKHGSELVFVTHFPASKRPFYTYPDEEDPSVTHGFDLIGRGMEWVTGGQRIHNFEQLVANIKKWGNDPKDFELYLQAFKYGMPPHGGFAIGAERLTAGLLGLGNVREASLFPRDMERIDFRLTKQLDHQTTE